MTKEELIGRYADLYRIIFGSEPATPLSFSSDGMGNPFLKLGSGHVDYVVEERGRIVSSERFYEIDELMYKIFSKLSFNKACDLELDNRSDDSLDSRILIFKYQVEFMKRAGSNWESRIVDHIRNVLLKFPIHNSR